MGSASEGCRRRLGISNHPDSFRTHLRANAFVPVLLIEGTRSVPTALAGAVTRLLWIALLDGHWGLRDQPSARVIGHVLLVRGAPE
jgi:hypothetical protein